MKQVFGQRGIFLRPYDSDGGGGSGSSGGGTGGGAGAGAGGTGGTVAGAQAQVLPAAPSQTNIGGIQATVAVAGVAVKVTPRRVQSNQRVYVRPLPQNTKPVRVALNDSLAPFYGQYDVVSPGEPERLFPVTDLGEIYIGQVAGSFVLGEGILINIRSV